MPSVSGIPLTRTTLFIPKDSSSGVCLNSSPRTASGFTFGLSVMSMRNPDFLSDRFFASTIPSSFSETTSSLIRLTAFSGPTIYGSSVTTIPCRDLVIFSNSNFALIRKLPLPVLYASWRSSSMMIPPEGKSGPGSSA